MHGGDEKCNKESAWKTSGKGHAEDLVIDGRILLQK
jgi:hypothetical protein